MNDPTYPCPCCGYIVFEQGPGSYDICKICFWEDDLSQLRLPTTTGANHVNLIEAQANYAQDGVCEIRLRAYVRPPKESERRDPDWRPINEGIDNIEEYIRGADYANTYPKDRTVLYYWRSSYWRR
jgi:hypothetical protein